jgi:hypothetical protein
MSESKKDFSAVLSKLKEAAIAFKAAMTPQKFGNSVLADGTEIEWEGEEPMVGIPVMVSTPEGYMPAPNGEYTLPENGTVLVIEAGVITTVTPAQATPEEAAPTNPAANTGMESQGASMSPAQAKEITERIEKVSKFMEDATERFASMEKMIADQSEVIATQKTENEALKSELLNFSKIVSDSLAEIGDQPQDTKEVEHNFRNENKGKESIEEFRKRVFNA